MTELHVRSVFAQVAEAAAAVHNYTAPIRRISKQARNELRSRIPDAVGNPVIIFHSRLKYLHEMADELARNEELDARADLEGLGVLHDHIAEIAIALPILVNPESVSCASFCERLAKLADEVHAIMVDAGYDESDVSVEPPFVFTASQRRIWTQHIGDWLQLIWTMCASLETLRDVCLERNRMPPLKLVRRLLNDFVVSASESYEDEASDGGFDFQSVAFQFRELISEQGDARSAYLVFLKDAMEQLHEHEEQLGKARQSAVESALEHFEAFKRPPLPEAAEQIGIILALMPLFLPEKLREDYTLAREVLNDCYLDLQRAEGEE